MPPVSHSAVRTPCAASGAAMCTPACRQVVPGQHGSKRPLASFRRSPYQPGLEAKLPHTNLCSNGEEGHPAEQPGSRQNCAPTWPGDHLSFLPTTSIAHRTDARLSAVKSCRRLYDATSSSASHSCCTCTRVSTINHHHHHHHYHCCCCCCLQPCCCRSHLQAYAVAAVMLLMVPVAISAAAAVVAVIQTHPRCEHPQRQHSCWCCSLTKCSSTADWQPFLLCRFRLAPPVTDHA
jgi:hypothetical protein